MLIRAVPTLEPIITMPSPILSNKAIPSAPVQQEEVMERRKKKAVGKKLGHYLFAHSEATNQRWAEASRALEEAHGEAEKAQAEADALKVA
ncbi:hypothetical protein COCNU_scaffold013027G000010 [Cocos nucifera]|nr:hypothetical protein [Cocos nucifera]